MQMQQMQKQEGDNVRVSAIHGNFDDAQSFLKRVFTNPDVNAYANDKGVLFSSANSINIGRLFPQIVYYVSTYVTLVDTAPSVKGKPLTSSSRRAISEIFWPATLLRKWAFPSAN